MPDRQFAMDMHFEIWRISEHVAKFGWLAFNDLRVKKSVNTRRSLDASQPVIEPLQCVKLCRTWAEVHQISCKCKEPSLFEKSLVKLSENKQILKSDPLLNIWQSLVDLGSATSMWTRWQWPRQWVKYRSQFVRQSSPNFMWIYGTFIVYNLFPFAYIKFRFENFQPLYCRKITTNRQFWNLQIFHVHFQVQLTAEYVTV